MLLVGLGNPGRKYERTRHNLGFLVADAVVRAEGLPDYREKFSGLFSKGPAWGRELAVLKPQTFMNLSGDSAQPAAAFLKVPPSGVLVVHDELDLPFGAWRFKRGGGHAGHNGLRSLIERFGTADFLRLRFGVGRPPPAFKGSPADFLLSPWAADEAAKLDALIAEVLVGLAFAAREGVDKAMNRFHPPPPKAKNPANKPGKGASVTNVSTGATAVPAEPSKPRSHEAGAEPGAQATAKPPERN